MPARQRNYGNDVAHGNHQVGNLEKCHRSSSAVKGDLPYTTHFSSRGGKMIEIFPFLQHLDALTKL